MALFHGLHGGVLGTQKQSPSSSSWVQAGWGDTRLSRAVLLPEPCLALLHRAWITASSFQSSLLSDSSRAKICSVSSWWCFWGASSAHKPLCFPTAHSSAQYWWGVGAGLFWGNGTLGNAGGRGKDQPGVASLGCSCCPHTPAPELERARDLKRNFSASWWISDWPFLLLVYEKKIKGTYLSSAGCP